MNDLDIPIFKKTYDLYKTFYQYRLVVPRQDRYALWQKCEGYLIELLECVIVASQMPRNEKLPVLENGSAKLNILRIFIRLMKDVRAFDNKKYLIIEEALDEIGRMLGGWIRSTKER